MTAVTAAAMLVEAPPRPAALRAATEPPNATELTTAELAECTCPEFCERDHERD
jgi:hypothetical protein